MKDLKEQLINLVTRTMSDNLSVEQLDMLTYAMSNILQSYNLTESKHLPSLDVADTDKLIRDFLACKKIEGCLYNTLIQYKYTITRFADSVNMDLKKVNTNTIRCYLGIIGRSNQNSYVDNIRRTLNTFYQWLEDEDYILKNPCKKIKKIKMEKKMEMPFSDEEIAILQDACMTPKEVALLDILTSTGIRREEITKIKLEDINFAMSSIRILGKGAKERIVYFSSRCKVHLQSYINNRNYTSEYLFASDRKPHNKLTVNSLHAYIKSIGERANIKNVHLHRFRKWFATTMINKGVKIQDLKDMMGHESLDTTNNYYIYSNIERIRSECRIHAV